MTYIHVHKNNSENILLSNIIAGNVYEPFGHFYNRKYTVIINNVISQEIQIVAP